MKWLQTSKARPKFGQLYLLSGTTPELGYLSALTKNGATFEGITGNQVTPKYIAAVDNPEAVSNVSYGLVQKRDGEVLNTNDSKETVTPAPAFLSDNDNLAHNG